jgi:hypothetical protein
LTQNLFAQLVELGFEAAAISFGAGIGEFAGGAFNGRLDSPTLALREIWVQEEAKLSRSVVQAAAIACSELP